MKRLILENYLFYDFETESNSRTVPDYLPGQWNFYDDIINDLEIPRTTNTIEGFHRGFRHRVSRGSPSVFEYINGIKEQQVLTDFHLDRLNWDITPAKRRKKENKDCEIKSLVKIFKIMIIFLIIFWNLLRSLGTR